MPQRGTIATLCEAFGIALNGHDCVPFGNGLINQTYLLKDRHGKDDWILQQVNTAVFTRPELIAFNNYLAAEHLRSHHPNYPFMRGKRTIDGKDLFQSETLGAWRVFPFYHHTVSHERATPAHAYSAAQQFGRLTKNLDGAYVGAFREVIPGFHDLAQRFAAFEHAITRCDPKRAAAAEEATTFFLANASIVDEFNAMKNDVDVRTRIVHNDTKLNNVLFDERTDEALYVIDLDTLMPGKALFDLGDMIRTFISSAAEDDPDPSQCCIDAEVLEQLVAGWCSEMGPLLSHRERQLLFWSGRMLMYEQGIRFLTDHLQGDLYYKVDRPGHNLDRAKNQMHLLKAYTAMEVDLTARIRKHLR